MPRVKRSVGAHKKRRKVLEQAKGYWGLKSTNYTLREGAGRALAPSTPTATARTASASSGGSGSSASTPARGSTGSRTTSSSPGLKAAEVELDRKVLADLAVHDPAAFAKLAEQAKTGARGLTSPARDLPPPGGVLRRPLAALRRALPALRRRRAGRARSRPTCAGTSRCGCSAACTTSCSAARRRGTTSMRRSTHAGRLPRALRRGAARPDERGRTRVGAASRRSSRSASDRIDLDRAGRERRAAPRASTASATATRRVVGERWPRAGGGRSRAGRPPRCSSRQLEIVRRRGIDRDPVDVTTAEGARLLESFVWADQAERLERLDAAIASVEAEPPELIRGDYVERLPGLLAERADDALTVVLTSVTTAYLDAERFGRFSSALERAGADGRSPGSRSRLPEGTASSTAPRSRSRPGPAGELRRLAAVDYHGAWLRWFAT